MTPLDRINAMNTEGAFSSYAAYDEIFETVAFLYCQLEEIPPVKHTKSHYAAFKLIIAVDELLRLKSIKGTPEYDAADKEAAWEALRQARACCCR